MSSGDLEQVVKSAALHCRNCGARYERNKIEVINERLYLRCRNCDDCLPIRFDKGGWVKETK